MKKLLCVIICILEAVCFAGCKETEEALSGEYRILELTEKKITDKRDFAVVDEDGEVWLDKDDVDTVFVSFEKSKNRYLELRLTEDGLKSFKKALKDEDRVLSITIDGEVIASPVVPDDIEENSAIVLGEYEDVINWFNIIT